MKDDMQYRPSKFRVALLVTIVLLIALHLVDKHMYPHTEVLPANFFFSVVIVQLFFLWYDGVKEKHRILWMQKKRNELNEMKDKFALITSHELMTPITVIREYVNLMAEKILGEINEKQKNALGVMNKYFLRLEEIKHNLSQLYVGAPPAIEERLELTSIEVLTRTTTEDVTPFIKRRNQTLSLEIERDIPHVPMDRAAIRQVIVNLLLNAIRFTPDKGRITVRAKGDKRGIRVEVEDSGIGIPNDKLEDIFESFYEIQDTSQHTSGSIEFKSGGMGVGLTIARNIIDAHEGEIWAESEVGKFSRFIFTLPKK